jgi:hypothetical protein
MLPTLREAVVPVLESFYQQRGEAAWGLMSSVAAAISTTVSATVAAATGAVATAVCVATTTTAVAVVAATVDVVAATATAAVTVAAGVVATVLMAAAVLGAGQCQLPSRAFEAAPELPRCWMCLIVAILRLQHRPYQSSTLHPCANVPMHCRWL